MKKSQKFKLQKKNIEYWSDVFDYKNYKVKVVKYIEINEKKEKKYM